MSTLPKGWTEVALGDVCDIRSGGTPSRARPDFYGGEVPWVKISDMLQGRIRTTDETITEEGLRSSTAKVFPAGTILLSIFATIGRTAVLECDAATNQAIAGVEIGPGIDLDPTYLRRFLESHSASMASQGRGAAQANINLSILKATKVPLPPLDEQRRIAAILDKADELRTKRRAALEQLDSLAEAIFLDMFGADLSGISGEVWSELNDVVDQGRPVCYGILKPGPDLDEGPRYVRVVDMRNGGIEPEGVRRTSVEIDHQYRRSRLRSGDILMSIRGHVGRLAIVPDELDGANITQDSARIAVDGADPTFVIEYLRSATAQRWMERNTKGVAVRGINIGDVRRIPFPNVHLERQRQFAAVAGPIQGLVREARQSAKALDELFASLQSRAFRGEL